jgi:hypothetical protein
MSKPIQIAVAATFGTDALVPIIQELVLCDDGRIFSRDTGYDDKTEWVEISGPWGKK